MRLLKEEVYCLGHRNEFQHLYADLEGLEKEFDVGFKYEERESDDYSTDPKTGIKAWAEPYLALYISVTHKESEDIRKTLYYGLTRSRFSSGNNSSDRDRKNLLALALPHVISDLKLLKEGKQPRTLNNTKML